MFAARRFREWLLPRHGLDARDRLVEPARRVGGRARFAARAPQLAGGGAALVIH